MLSHKEILPNGYFKKPSEKIHFEKYNLRVPVVTEEFVAQDSQRGLIASISSFGFGGSNLFISRISYLMYVFLRILRTYCPART
jgi:acyl transferase domain-containing protein